MVEFIIKTEHAHYECETKDSLNEKLKALSLLKLPFQVFKNYSVEFMPLLVPVEKCSFVKVVR